METKFELVLALHKHARMLEPRLTPACVAEITGLSGISALDTMQNAIKASSKAYTCLVNGQVEAIVGIISHSILSKRASIWLLLSVDARKYPITLMKMSKIFLGLALSKYDVIENVVDERNVDAIRFLKWNGFTIEPAVPYGPNGLSFHHYHKART